MYSVNGLGFQTGRVFRDVFPFFFKVFHFALNVMCCLHRATSSVSSAFLLSLAVNKKSVLGRGGTYQPLQVEHRDRLSGHKTKQFASRRGSGVVKRNVFFHIISFIFFFLPPIKFSTVMPAKVQLQQRECQWRMSLTVFNHCVSQTCSKNSLRRSGGSLAAGCVRRLS